MASLPETTKEKEVTTVTCSNTPLTPVADFTSGYDCQFVEPPPEVLSTECSICLHILRKPHQVSCCGSHFCLACIEGVQQRNEPCPHCKEEFKTVLDKSLQRKLGNLKVYCTHKSLGCDWTGELRKLDAHLRSNPEKGHELSGCEYTTVGCSHGCGEQFQRRFLPEHLKTCLRRPFLCNYCSQYTSTYKDVVTNHLGVCGHYPILCPNNCEVSPIKRKDLEEHVAKECTLQTLKCEFEFASCTASLPRKDMAQHLKENQQQHISQLSRTTASLSAELMLLKAHGSKLTRQVEELSARTDDHVMAIETQVLEVCDSLEESDKIRQLSVAVSQRTLGRRISQVTQWGIVVLVVVAALMLLLLQSSANQQTQEIAELSKQMARYEHLIQIEELKRTVAKNSQTLSANQQTQEIAELSKQMARYEHQIEELKSTVVKNSQTLSANQQTQEIAELSKQMARYEHQIEELKRTVAKNSQTLSANQQTQEIAELNKQIGRYEHQIEELKRTVAKNSHTFSGIDLRVLELEEKMRTVLEKDSSTSTSDSCVQQEQLDKLKEELLKQLDTSIDPTQSLVIGPGITTASTGQSTSFLVIPATTFGIPCISSQLAFCSGTNTLKVVAKLIPEADFSVRNMYATVSMVLTDTLTPDIEVPGLKMSAYNVTYTPEIRGISQLHIEVNNEAIRNSPFEVFVHHDPTKLGTPVMTIPSVVNPWGVAVNSRGELFVTEHSSDKISVFDTNFKGKLIRTITSKKNAKEQFFAPTGIAMDTDDNIYVVTRHKLIKFTREGSYVTHLKEDAISEHKGIAFYENELHVCYSSDHHIFVYDLNLKLVRKTDVSEQLSHPSDVAFDPRGGMYVTDSVDGHLVMFGKEVEDVQNFVSPGGVLSFRYFRGKKRPQGIAIFDNYIYISDIEANIIAVFTIDGEFVHSFGATGHGSGEFDHPIGLAMDSNGFLYVCDYNNDRIQVF